MGYEVFISHSSKDKPAADAVCTALEANGIRCWIAPRDILPGTDWSEAIVAGIAESPVTVLVFSEHANASVQVRREVQRAFEKGKSVVPLRIEPVMPSDAMEYYLGPVHWLDAVAPPLESHLTQLVETVRRLLPARAPVPDRPPAAAPIPVAPPIPPGNLPEPPTPYVGRAAELAAWRDLLLEPTTRVFTLLGFGGMGKSRSALELATRCVADFQGGVWWIELCEATTAEEMVQRIATQLGLELMPQPPVRDQLKTWLRARNALLVLDNTEQIADAGAVVSDLLKIAPQVKWLVTSRRALEMTAERTVEVLPLPPEDAETLFIERARARSADFARTPENGADIAELCRRLEGMPLAIELAASRITGMTPREILGRLDEWFRLLQTRAPHLPPRQRALHGAIEWSHDLLTDDDKDLFAQLAVFASGFTLNAAEAVCDVFDVFEGVHELRRHSFLRSETHAATQQMRFLMLELVRDYAAQKLTDTEARRRHAEFFLRFAEERAAKLRTRDEAPALDELLTDRDNLRAALNWAKASGENELCARLALALYAPLYYGSLWNEVGPCLQAGFDASAALTGAARRLRAELALRLAGLAHDRGDNATAAAQGEASLALYRERDNAAGIADALNLLGLLALEAGDTKAARRQFDESLALRAASDHAGRARTLHNRALLARRGGDPDTAARLYEECLTHRRAAGDARGEAETLGNLGVLAHTAGDHEEARRLYNDSLVLRRTLRDRHGIALMLHNLGELAEADGEPARAVALFVHAERIFRDLQSVHAAAPSEFLSRLAAHMGAESYAAARRAAEQQAWEALVTDRSIE